MSNFDQIYIFKICLDFLFKKNSVLGSLDNAEKAK